MREFVPGLAAAEYPTVLLPVPLAPEVIVSQGTLLAAVQLHVAPAVTPTVPDDAPVPMEVELGEIE